MTLWKKLVITVGFRLAGGRVGPGRWQCFEEAGGRRLEPQTVQGMGSMGGTGELGGWEAVVRQCEFCSSGASQVMRLLRYKPKRLKGQAGKLHTNKICLLFVETVSSLSIGICEAGRVKYEMYVMYDVCYLLSDIHRVVVIRAS